MFRTLVISIPTKLTKGANSISYNFIGNGKDKVKNAITLDIEKGGLNMIDID